MFTLVTSLLRHLFDIHTIKSPSAIIRLSKNKQSQGDLKMSKEMVAWEIVKQTGVLQVASTKVGSKSTLEAKEAETMKNIHEEQDIIIEEYNRVLNKLK